MNIAMLWDICLRFEYDQELLVSSLGKWLEGQKHQKILDCACGTGFPSLELIKMGYNITCSDASAEMLALFNENARKVGLSINPVCIKWQLLGAQFCSQFDIVICRGSSLIYADCWDFDNMPDEKVIYDSLKSFRDCLAPGGILYVDTTSEAAKHYIFEFIIMFLAVAFGFLSENLREKISDNVKEKTYITSILTDLKVDSNNLSALIKYYFPTHDMWIDSAIHLLGTRNGKSNDRLTYLAIQNATYWKEFNPTERTLLQLKSTGNYILIKKKKVADALADYDLKLAYYNTVSLDLNRYQNSIDTSQLSITDYRIVRKIFKIQDPYTLSFLKLSDIPPEAKVLSNDHKQIRLYCNKLKQINVEMSGASLGQDIFILERLSKLIRIIEDEYRL